MIWVNDKGELEYTNPALEPVEAQTEAQACITEEDRISALESAVLELAEVVLHA